MCGVCKSGNAEKLSGEKDSGYRGFQTKTISGKNCKRWDDMSEPNIPYEKCTPSGAPNDGLGSHNYCRNPNPEGCIEDTIWCYTDDPSVRFEKCKPIEEEFNDDEGGDVLLRVDKDSREDFEKQMAKDWSQMTALIMSSDVNGTLPT